MQREKGLTLIEVLVVIFVVGVIYSMVTLSINVQDDKRLEDEGKRIAALLKLAREEAIMQNRELAMEFEEETYRFVEWGEEGKNWSAYAEKGMFREREIPKDIELEFVIDGEEIKPAFENLEELSETPPPRIFVFSSGEMSPFEVSLSDRFGDNKVVVKGGFNGELELETHGEED